MMIDTVVISAVGIVMTSIATFIGTKINSYINERKRNETKKEALLELHYIKLDAVIYTLGTVGEHRKEFEITYSKRYKQMLNERQDLQEIVNQNS